MEKKMSGLSLEFIIHPGETIKEFLEDRNMKQEELAIRTGFTAKHVSEVVNGKKDISPAFARCLEYAFGVPMSFWINLQGIYDREILEYREQQEIDEKELEITKKLKGVLNLANKLNVAETEKNIISQVIELRVMGEITDLRCIPELCINKVSFRKSQTVDTDIYILYFWLRVCELYSKQKDIEIDYDREKLLKSLEKIKKCMLLKIDDAIEKMTRIFADCGMIFQVVDSVKGAPVQGFIKRYNGKIILTMTTRRKLADEFWFTLFHEIGHLINGDVEGSQFVDYPESYSEMEEMADLFATDTLINPNDYKCFISQDIDEDKIIKFAKSQNVTPFIVVGRLQKERNDFKLYHKLKVTYNW